jgi:hypothetical protein
MNDKTLIAKWADFRGSCLTSLSLDIKGLSIIEGAFFAGASAGIGLLIERLHDSETEEEAAAVVAEINEELQRAPERLYLTVTLSRACKEGMQ